nr:PREDICTED: tubulin polyglutamylase complex subunit 2 isoform X1 [Bemisia tabaci]
MSYIVDVVSEDSFFKNLTLGITDHLSQIQCIKNIKFEKRPPCERAVIAAWEQRYTCILPDDVRQFYSSIDGFRLTWDFQYGDSLLPIGNMSINPICELQQIGKYSETSEETDTPSIYDVELMYRTNGLLADNVPSFGSSCSIFVIEKLKYDMGDICLVFNEQQEYGEDPKICFMDTSYEWHLIADNFTQYFRMMLAHLGMPLWQLKLTPLGLSLEADSLISLIAPHLLQTDASCYVQALDLNDFPSSNLDASVFKMKKQPMKG